jgi:small subunit ribosomal protein S6
MALRDYELMYIVRPNVAEDELAGATDKVESMIKGLGGEVSERNPWGKRRLAYPIQRYEDGYYIVEKIKLDPNRARDLEEQLRISDDVIRHILVV